MQQNGKKVTKCDDFWLRCWVKQTQMTTKQWQWVRSLATTSVTWQQKMLTKLWQTDKCGNVGHMTGHITATKW